MSTQNPAGQSLVCFASILSVVAMLVSVGTAYWTYRYDPLGPGLSQYDFTTPKASLISSGQMVLDNNWRAMMELNSHGRQRQLAEMLQTLRVHKEAEWRGHKLLFVSYDENGVPKHSVESFTKNAETGLWQTSTIRFEIVSASLDGSKDAEPLSEMISLWEDKGRLE